MPGMPGMGMNPMNMPPMAGNFGMQGMGGMDPTMMNMMEMMGMNGMNGMMGAGFNGGGFDGWNNTQQMSAGFGASGFFPNGGFNQSNQGQFPQMSQHQQYPKNNFHNQNRFPGPQRGYGRGYHNQGNGQFHNSPQVQHSGPPPGAPKGPKAAQGYSTNSDAFHHQLPQTEQSRRSSVAMSVEPSQDPVDQHAQSGPFSDKETGTGITGNTDGELTKPARDIDTGTLAQDLASNHPTDHNEQQPLDYTQESSIVPAGNSVANGVEGDSSNVTTAGDVHHDVFNQSRDQSYQIGTVSNPAFPTRGGFHGRGVQDSRGGSIRGRGGPNWQYHGTHGPQQIDVKSQIPSEPKGSGVQGAPKGPRAMREGLPNTGWSGRGRGMGRGAIIPQSPISVVSAPASIPPTPRLEQQVFPESCLFQHRLIFFSNPSDRPRSRSKERSRSRSRSQSRRHRSRRHRSRTPSSESEQDRKRERRHRSSRKYDDEDTEIGQTDNQDYEDDKGRRRSHDTDHHRSTKSRRESSRDRRRHKHRSKSRSPTRGEEAITKSLKNGDDREVEKKPRDKYRDRSRERSRDKEREERDRDRRDRDKKRSRRDRSESRESDRHHRSSRRSKKDKERDRDRDRDYDRDVISSAKSSQPQTPIEPETEFKIQGRSKDRRKLPPTGPSAMQPPTGPRTQTQPKNQIKLALEARNSIALRSPVSSRRGPANSHPPTPTSTTHTAPPTPTSAAPIDPYQQERENARKARELKEEQRRATLHGPAAQTNQLSRKRSYEAAADTDDSVMPPTGPKGDRSERRGGGSKRSRDSEGKSNGKSRRTSYKYEDEISDERTYSRAESEREAARYD
jgi:hypothetical protein